ncbi:forkhead box protein I3a [Scomber scombrus]|uniref:Forkhead box protein I3a n=1 Tax=Scomber scombrus TaxID=13677 RepID=A0AAV1QBU4_SCOSC
MQQPISCQVGGASGYKTEQSLSPPQQELLSLGLDPSDFSMYSPPPPPEPSSSSSSPWPPHSDPSLCLGPPAAAFFPQLYALQRPLLSGSPWFSFSSQSDMMRMSFGNHNVLDPGLQEHFG